MSVVATLRRLRQRELIIDELGALILERFALNPDLIRSGPIAGLNKNQISTGFEGDYKISRSATIERFKKFEEYGLIKEISRIKHNTGDYKKFYDLTTFGILKWFEYLRENRKNLSLKKIKQAITRSGRLMPWISNNWVNLKELFLDESVMTMTLLWSSDIHVDNYLDGNLSSSVASAPISIGRFKFYLHTDVLDPRITNNKTITISEELNDELAKLFTFIFLHNLTQSFVHNNIWYSDKEPKVISLIKSDPVTFDTYSRFIGQIERGTLHANEFVKHLDERYSILDKRRKKSVKMANLLNKQINEWKKNQFKT